MLPIFPESDIDYALSQNFECTSKKNTKISENLIKYLAYAGDAGHAGGRCAIGMEVNVVGHKWNS